jgi:tetratricopeptide (TPR) repeat protein
MSWTGLHLRIHGHKDASLDVLDRAIKWFEDRPREEAETELHRSRIAYALYYSERWEESQLIFESLHNEFPDNVDYLGMLGSLKARRGDKEKALNISNKLESVDQPYIWGWHTYYRARIAALLGDKKVAVRLLREAFSQGVAYPRYHHEMDLEPLYDYPPFVEFLKPRG